MLLKKRAVDNTFHGYGDRKTFPRTWGDGKPAVRTQSPFIRLFDIVFSFSGLVLLLPVTIIAAAAVKLTSRGPFIFVQERLGYRKRPFKMVKLRTMVHSDGKEGPLWAEINDIRITPVGRILRRTKIDELPQMFNILKGDMSFVGPRPVTSHSAALLEEYDPSYKKRFMVKPGLTGWAQINVAHGTTVEEHHRKLRHDLQYLEGLSLTDYFRVIFKTLNEVYVRKRV